MNIKMNKFFDWFTSHDCSWQFMSISLVLFTILIIFAVFFPTIMGIVIFPAFGGWKIGELINKYSKNFVKELNQGKE